MKKIFFVLITLTILVTCKKDAFDEEGEMPVVFYNVETSATEGGSIDKESGSIASGTSITITATPNQGYIFTGWSGINSTENPLTITVDNDLRLTANFEKKKYSLTVNIEGEGTVTKEIVNGGKSTDYDSGSIVKLTAVPNDGYAHMRWRNNGVLDTLNPIQITIDDNKNVDVNFDYQNARDLVGTWEFDLQESESAKSHGKIIMRISIQLNILFTLVLNNVTTQIYTSLTSLSSTSMVMGNIGVLTNINFTSSTSLGFSLITLPQGTGPLTSAANIPAATPGNSINLTGGKKTSTNSAPFTPPSSAVTSNTSGTSSSQALSNIVSTVLSASASSTNASPCTGSIALTSGPSSQTVSATTAITTVNYVVSTNCTDTTTLSATGLPPGVTMNYTSSSGLAVVSGTPSGAASGTYNYSILAMYAPTSDATASSTISGTITVLSASASSTTASTSFSLDVTASNSSNYTLSGTDRNGIISGSDPNLTFSVGDTISFVVNASGHPFYLKTVRGTGTGDTISGLTNNGTESATISWTPTTAGTFYYQCSLHAGMVGTITIQ